MKYFKYLLILIPMHVMSQFTLQGTILEANKENVPVAGANVYWLNTTVGTVTDFNGNFKLPYKKSYKQLIISHVGYKTDTIQVNSSKEIIHFLEPTSNLDEVTISTRKKTTSRSYLESRNIVTII